MATQTYSAEVLINTAKATRNIDEARKGSDQLNKSLTTLFATMRGGQGDLNSMAKALESISSTVAQAKKSSQELADAKIAESKAVAQASKAMDSGSVRKSAGATRDLAKGIDETASASARLKANSPEETLNRSAQAATKFGDSLANQRYLLYDIGATYRTLAIAAQAIPVASVAAASAYERDFAQVMRVTGQTTGMSQDLRAELKQLGSEIPLSFAELSNIAQIGGQMDVPAEQLGKFTETVAKFVATADGATIDSTTQAFGRMANLFNQGDNFDPEFFNRLGSAISMTADNAVTSEAKIISMLDKLAPVAKQAGLSATEVTAFASALSSVGLAPEISSGFFTRFFGQMNKDVAAGSERLNTYAQVLGVSVAEFKQMHQNNPSAVLQGVAKAMSGMDKVSQTSLLGELGVKATRDQRVLAGLSSSYHVLEQAMGDVDEAYKKASYLDATSSGVFGTFASNLKELGNAVANLGDSIGAGPLAVLSHIVESLTGFTQAISATLDQVPALKGLLGVFLNMASIAGIFLAAKSALAFLTASMVAFQQATRSGLTSAMNLRGTMTTMATTMLAARGATEQTTASLLRQQGAMGALRVAATTTNGSIQAMNAGQAGARSAALRTGSSFKTVASNLLGMVNPLGIAIGAVGFLATSWYTASQEAKQGAEEVVRAFAQTDAAGAEALANSLAREKAGLFTSGTNKFFDDNIGESFLDIAKKINVGVDDITAAMAGGKDTLDAYIASLERAKEAAPSDLGNEYGIIINKLKGYSDEMQVAEDIAEATKTAQDELGVSTEQAGDAFTDSTADVQNWTSALNDAVAQAFGFIDAQGALAAAMEKLGGGLVESASFNVGDSGGRDNIANLQATLQAQALVLQQSIQAGEISAQQAADAYEQFASSLMNEIANMGGNVSETVGQVVTDAVAEIQGTFLDQAVDIPVTANTEPVVQDVSSVMEWLDNYIADPKNILLAAGGVDETAQEVNALVQYIAEQTGLPFVAVVDALTNPAGENTEQVAKFMKEVVNTDYTAFINADTSAAASNVQNFAAFTQAQMQEIAIATAGATAALGIGVGAALAPAIGLLKVMSTPAQMIKTANQQAAPTFAPLVRGYDDAAKKAANAGRAAKGAGDKSKKAGDAAKKAADKAAKAAQKLAKEWDAAEQQISGFASRVGSAFQYVFAETQGVQSARDEYYSTLNGIRERLEQQKKTVRELRDENKKLNAERRVQLNDASKLDKMAGYADAMGNKERAKYYRDEAKALKESAKETQNKVNANEKEAKAIEKGIGNLKGYSKEAIENRAELRRLEQASLKVAEAYAASGASAKTVADRTREWTNRARTHSTQLGYNRRDVNNVTTATDKYIKKLAKVPKTIKTTVNQTTNLRAKDYTKSGVAAANRSLRSVPSSKTSTIKARETGAYGVNRTLNSTARSRTAKINTSLNISSAQRSKFRKLAAVFMATGNLSVSGALNAVASMYKGGMVGSFASGGLIPGTPPSDPKKDNIMATVDGKGMAAIRSGEYIQSQPAVDYYGTTFMDKLNRMEIPRYYMGGSVGGNSNSGGNTLTGVIDLSSETVQALARLIQKDVYLYADTQQLAQSVQKGMDVIAQRGGSL